MLINRTLAITCLVCFVLGACIGAWGMHTFTEDLRTQLQVEKNKPPKVQVQEKIQTVTDTKIAYVPGETVYLPAPTPTNPNATVATKLDGDFQIGKPTFTYRLNGKVSSFNKTDDERFIFDKNEVKLTQSSAVSIDIKTVEQPKAKIGAYAEVSQDLGTEAGVIAAYQSRKFDVELKYNNERQGKLQFNAWL